MLIYYHFILYFCQFCKTNRNIPAQRMAEKRGEFLPETVTQSTWKTIVWILTYAQNYPVSVCRDKVFKD